MPTGTPDRYLLALENRIVLDGWAVQSVVGDATGARYSYTVGLHRAGLAELIVFALPPAVAKAVLDDLAARSLAGADLAPGMVRRDILVGYPISFLQVWDAREHLTLANAVAGDQGPVVALQVVMPDIESRWPWEPASELARTPLLGPVPTWAT